jgi:4-amino-4-deoxy-L-arabinose transferase-like glycosyltransferase
MHIKEIGKRWISVPLILFAVTLLSRIHYRSTMLYNWDSVQYALGMEHFDITTHQPHPPGYFLYIMVGRLLNNIINDANASLVSMSIIFSGLLVAVIYLLAEQLYDRRTAFAASVLTVSSPLLWFYGEVASPYVTASFFSALIAYLCWRIIRTGDRQFLWTSAFVLALAGGIRQSTFVFMIPIWLYSIRKYPLRHIAAAGAILGIGIASWFVPMTIVTGGYVQYRAAVKELWDFAIAPYTFMHVGLQAPIRYAQTVALAAFLCAGLSLMFMPLCVIAHFRRIKRDILCEKSLFIVLWGMPAVLYFVLVIINPSNPAIGIIFAPVLIIVIARSLTLLIESVPHTALMQTSITMLVVAALGFNIYWLFLDKNKFSLSFLPSQETHVMSIVRTIRRNFDPKETIILSRMLLLSGARHFMYYLPEFRVYVMDENHDLQGNRRKVYWGQGRRTFLSDGVYVPQGTRYFISAVADEQLLKRLNHQELATISFLENDSGQRVAFYGDIWFAQRLYQGVEFKY